MKFQDEKSRNIISGAAWLTFSVVIVKIIGFIYKLPLSYLLKDEGMGYFNTAYTVFSFFYLLCTGGVPRAVSILVAEGRAKGREYHVSKILRSAISVFLAVGTFFSVFLIVFAPAISNIIGNDMSAFSLICIAPSLSFVAAGGVFRGYLNGEARLKSIALASVLEGVIKFVFGLLFAIVGVKLKLSTPIISALTILGVTFGSFVGTLIMFISSAKALFLREKDDSAPTFWETVKRIIFISAPLTLSSAIMGITNIIDLGLIMHRLVDIGYTETEAGALYGNYSTLAVPMLGLIIALVTQLGTAALPVITERFIVNDKLGMSDATKSFVNITSFFVIPISIGFMLFPEEILLFLFEDSSAILAAKQLSYLAPSIAFVGILTMTNTALEGTGDTVSPLIAMSLGAVVKLIVSYLLIGTREIGIGGAPLGTTFSYFISMVISCIILYKKHKINAFFSKSIWLSLLFSVSSVLPCKILYKQFSGGRYSSGSFLLCFVICVTAYLLFNVLFSVFDKKSSKNMSFLPKIHGMN